MSVIRPGDVNTVLTNLKREPCSNWLTPEQVAPATLHAAPPLAGQCLIALFHPGGCLLSHLYEKWLWLRSGIR